MSLLQRLIIAFIFSASISTLAVAQSVDRQAFQERIQNQAEVIKQRLNISEEQMPLFETLFQQRKEKTLAIFENYEFGSDKELNFREKIRIRSALKKVHAETNASLSEILTSAQMVELKKIQEEPRSKMRTKLKNRE